MGIWTIILCIIIIYQNHVFTAPLANSGSAKKGDLKTKFGKIADQIINPQWTLTDPDLKKKQKDSVPSNNTVNENDGNQPNTKNNDTKRRPKKNNKRRSNKLNNKKRSNKTKQYNIRRNGRHRWYKMITVDNLLGNLPEYRNHEDGQNIVLIWGDGDERKIEMNEHVDALSMRNLHNNQLIRKKRDYNNTFQLQNKLQTKNVKWEDSKENEKDKLNIEANTDDHKVERQNKKLENKQNLKKKKPYKTPEIPIGPNPFDKELVLIDNLEDDENSMNSNSIENTNENMKFLKFKNSNKNKFQHFVKNKKHPTETFQNNQTYRNKLKGPNQAQQLDKTSRKNNSEMERSRLKTAKQKKNSLNDIPTISKYEPEINTKGNANTVTEIPELNKIGSIMYEMNSNTDKNLDNQNDELLPSSLETKLDNPNNINEKGTHKKNIIRNSPKTKDILIISYDEPETTKVNFNIVEDIPVTDEIDTIMDAMNSISDEILDDQNNRSYPSSLETKQEIPNYSDIEDIKERDILNNIKNPLKPKSGKLGKKQSDDNDKLPTKIKQKITQPSEPNNDNEKGAQQKSIKPLAQNLNEIPRKSIDVPNLTTGETYDKVINTPEPNEIDTIMDAMNSNSDEKLEDYNNGSYPSSLETKEDILNYSDVKDIKERDILNYIKNPLKPKSGKLGKKQSDDNDKLPTKIKQKITQPSEPNNDNEKGSPQKSIKPLAQDLNEITRKSIDVPNVTTGQTYDKVINTPEPNGIDTILEAMNSNSDEHLEDQYNGSYPSSLETKEEIFNFSDVKDIKERDILNNIKNPLKPKSGKLGQKQSDDNDKLPKKIKRKITHSSEQNNDNETGTPQKYIKPLAQDLNEITRKLLDVPNVTTKGTYDKVINTPEPNGIDTLLEELNSNSDEKLEDQYNGSYPSSLETKEEISNYSDVKDIKERDILNNIKNPLKLKSGKLGKKQSDDNDKLPKKIIPKIAQPLEYNNDNKKESPQKSIKQLAQNLNEIPRNANNVPNVTSEGTVDKVINTPGPNEIDTIMDAMNSNSDEKLEDHNNGSYPSSLETKEEISNYSDLKDIKERDILNNIKNPLKPKSGKLGKKQSDDNDKLPKKIIPKITQPLEPNHDNEKESPQKSIKQLAQNLNGIPRNANNVPNVTSEGTVDKVINTPEPNEIDTIMEELNSNSDEQLEDQYNGSYPSSLETKEEISNYSDVKDIKERDILNNIKNPLKLKSGKLGKKQSDDNDKLPKKIIPKIAQPLEYNNDNKKESPQKSIKQLAQNLNEIPRNANNVPNVTSEGTVDKVINTPEPIEIDTIMDAMNSNSDEKLEDHNNGSYPSSLETKEEISNYSDLKDIKERDILNNIKNPLKPKSGKLGKKQSDDNDKLPKKIIPKITQPLEPNHDNEKESPQKSIKQLAQNLNGIPRNANNVPNVTSEGTVDKVINTPEPNEIDTIMEELNSNSDEQLEDQYNGSYPSSLETKEEISNYSDVKDIKERDILNNIKNPLKLKSGKLGKKQSDDNDKLPKKIIPKIAQPLEYNNDNKKESPQKSIKQLAQNLNEIPRNANNVPNVTSEGTVDKVINTPEPIEIDTIMDAMNSNSDEKLEDHNNGSYPSSLETKEEISNYSDLKDIKERDILNNIKNPLKPKSGKLGKKQSDDNDKLPKKIIPKITQPLEPNHDNEKESPQKSIKQLAQNLNGIPRNANNVPNVTSEGTVDKVINTPEPNEIDTILEELNTNSDEQLEDQYNGSYPSSLETKEEISNYSDVKDVKEREILNNIKNPLKPKSGKLGKKQSDDNDKLPKKIIPKITQPLEPNNDNEKESPQKSIKQLAQNLNGIPRNANNVPNVTSEGTVDKVINTPEPNEIDTIMDAMNSNSDEKLEDHNNGSYPSSLETKEEISNYSDLKDVKERDILNNIKNPLKPKSGKLGKKQSDDNDKLPKKIIPKITQPLEPNNDNEKESPQKSIKQLAQNLNGIPRNANNVPNVTSEGTVDKVINTLEPNEIDTIMDAMNSNSDEKLEDHNNGSYPSSLETKEEISNYSDVKDVKEREILNNIKNPLKPKSGKLGKKQSDDNDKLPKKIIPKITQPLEPNNDNEKESPQKSIKQLAQNLNGIPRNANNVPNVTSEGTVDKVINTPEPNEIDTIMDAMNSNSDEKLEDHNNGSYPSSLETKEEISNYSDLKDVKERDILNNIKNPLKPKSGKLGKKQSDDNDKLPKKIIPKITQPLEPNNDNEKESPQKSIKQLAQNLNGIPRNANNVPNVTSEGTVDKVINTLEPNEIDTIMDAMNSNSDEKLEDHNNGSYPSSLETKEEISNYSDLKDVKERDILNNIKNPLKPKSGKLGKKQSDDNDKLPKKIIPKITQPLKPNNDNEKESPQKSFKQIAQNLNGIPRNANNVPNVTSEGTVDKVINTPEPKEIDTIMDAMNSNSDEKLEDHNNGSYPSSLETKEEISNYSDLKDVIERDILNNIKNPLKPKSGKLGKKQSDDNDKLPKKIIPKITQPLEPNNDNEKESPQKSIKQLAQNLNGIPRNANNVPNVTSEGTVDKVINTPEPKEIDTIMDAMNLNSDEKLEDHNNGSYPSSLKTKEDISNYGDDKKYNILKILEHPIKPTSKKLSTYNKKLPNKHKIMIGTTDEYFNNNSNMDGDRILQKVTQPNPIEKETGKPISDDDAVNFKSINPYITKDEEGTPNGSPGYQKIVGVVDKPESSSIEELLNSQIPEDGLKLPSTDTEVITVIPIEKIDGRSFKSKDDEVESSIPNDHNSQNIIEKNKSMEKLNPNSNTIIETPHIMKETVPNKYDKPNIYSKTQSKENPDTDIDVLDISDDYNNLGGMTMEDSDLKKTEHKLPKITDKQDNNLTETKKSIPDIMNETIKPDLDKSIDPLYFSIERPDDLLEYINDLSSEKSNEEKESDNSIVFMPTKDQTPKTEKGFSTDETFDKNSNMDGDSILQKVNQQNPIEMETGKPIFDDDAVNFKSINPYITKDEEGTPNGPPGYQKIVGVVDKPESSSIEELLNSHIPEDGLKLPSTDTEVITVIPIEKIDESSFKSKDDEVESSIPNDHNSQNIIEKNKSMEKLNPNSNTIIETPHIMKETVPNKYDKPNIYSKTLSKENPDTDIDVLDISDDYNNLGGMTMDDSDLKKTEHKLPKITDKQDNNLTEKKKSIPDIMNETIKPDLDKSIDPLYFSIERPDDLLEYINDLSSEKSNEEKESDNSIVFMPTKDQTPKTEKGFSTDETFDKNSNMDGDSILQKVTHQHPIEMETGKPISDDDAVNFKSINPYITKDKEGTPNGSPGFQKIVGVVDKPESSSIEELLNSLIPEDGLTLPSTDTEVITVIPIEKIDGSSFKSKDDEFESSIPNDHNSQNIIEKNKSMEKLNPNSNTIIETPHIMKETVPNKYDKPNIYSKTLSKENSDTDIDVLDISDDYSNLGGMTMEDSDLKKTEHKLPKITDKQDNNLTEKKKSIPDIMNETIKPDLHKSIDPLYFSIERPDDLLEYINNLSSEKSNEEKESDNSIVFIPTKDQTPKTEKEFSTDETFDKNSNMDGDSILQKVTRPNPIEMETGKPISDDDAINFKSINPYITKDKEGTPNGSPGSQKIVGVVDKPESSSIEELLNSLIPEDGLTLPSTDTEVITVIPIEKIDGSSFKSKDDEVESSIPNDQNSQNIIEKNKSMEKLNPNSNTIIETPHIMKETVPNKYDKPNIYSKTLSKENPDTDIDVLDISKHYNNLGGITMEDSDLKKSEHKLPKITDQQDNNLTEKKKSIPDIMNETIKPDLDKSIDPLYFSIERPDDLLEYINNLSSEKSNEEKESDNSIVFMPTKDHTPKTEKGFSTDETFDKNSNMDGDSILQKVTQQNPIEMETGKPISDDDAVNFNSINPYITKDEEGTPNGSPGYQKIVCVVDKPESSSIEELLNSHIPEDGLKLPSTDTEVITVIPIEKIDESSFKSKDDEVESSIPNDHNSQNIIEKNKSMEKLNPNSNTIIETPHIMKETVPNEYDKPNIYSKTLSKENSDTDIDVLDISDDYNNLGGMTMEDSDLKKTEHKLPKITDKQDNNLTEKKKSIPDIMNETIKPDLDKSIDPLYFSIERPDDLLEYINDLSSEKSNEEKESDNSIVFMPTKDQTPKTEKGFSTDETFDKNSFMDGDSILQKVTQQNPIELETGKPISDDDAVNFKSINPYITKDEEGTPNGSPGYQKIVGVVDKPESSSIEELLNSHIPEDGLKLPSTDTEVITVIPIEKIDESSFKSKDDEVESSIPNYHNSQNVIEKNKSMEKLNPNSYTIIETPHIMKETVPNKYDKPNIYSKTLSKENPDTDIDVLDISDDYNNLGGMTMEDSDLKKSEHKLPKITDQQDNNLTEKKKSIPDIMNETITPDLDKSIDPLYFSIERPDDLLEYINNLSSEKSNEEKESDNSIVFMPTKDHTPKTEKGFSTDETFDKNSNMDGDSILQKVTQQNPIEMETGKPISDDDAVNFNSINPYITKDEEGTPNGSPGYQKIVCVVDKPESSSIEELLNSHIPEDGLKLPSTDTEVITVIPIEKIDESSFKSKDDEVESSIPNDHNSQNIIEKNKSMEKLNPNSNTIIETPHIMKETVPNKYDKPNIYSKTLSKENSDTDIDVLDISDDYNNLGGMTMEDSDLKKTEHKLPKITDKQDNNLTEKKKSIPDIMNDTIKPDLDKSIDPLYFSIERPDDLLEYINDLSSEKSNEEKESDNSIVFMPTKDQTPKTEKGFSTDETFDKNSNMDGDSILQKVTQQNPIELETGKPISDDDAVNFKSINPYITKDEEGTPNGSPGYQKIVGVVDKPESSSIEELLNSHIPEDGLKLPSTDTEVITVIPIEKIDESSFKSKDDEVESSIPNDHNSQNIIEKNKSMEKLNPNSYTIIETPPIMKETVPNKYDKPNIYSKTLSKKNPDTDIDVLDISDDYNNLGGMTMEDSDLKKSEHKLPNITDKLDINLTKKNKLIPDIMNKAIKPEIADNIGSLNFFNEKPENVLMYNNGLSYEKANEVNPSDKSIVLEPKLNIIPKSEKGFSTDEIFDKNSNMDGDSILQKVNQQNPIEMETGKPISDDDAVNFKSINPYITKDKEGTPNGSPGSQKIVGVVDKPESSSIEELLNSLIPEDGLTLPSTDTEVITVIPIEKIDGSSFKSKDDEVESSIPNDHNSQNIIEKNISMAKLNPNSNTIIETPHIMKETVPNKYDKPNIYSKTQSKEYSDTDIDVLDISDDYNNLGGMTMEDSDLKKIEHKLPKIKDKQDNNLTEKKKSIPDIMNETIKPDLHKSIDPLYFSIERPDDLLEYTNNLSSEKSNEEKESDNSIVFMPTKDQTPKTEKGFSTDETFDKNSNMDGDSILQKVTQQNPIEMETGKPISDDDAVNFKSINPYITKDKEGTPNGSPGSQKIVGVVDKPESSSIEELLNSLIPEDGLTLPSTDTEVITVIPIEKIDGSSFKSKDDEVESSIPNDHNSQNIIEKNISMAKLNPNSNTIIETPHIMKETVPNKYDKPNIYSKTQSKEYSDTDIDVLDISDDYNNLGGMTMEDSDLKKIEHKLPKIKDKQDNNLTEKKKSIPDIMNETIKPDLHKSIDPLYFSIERPDDLLEYTNNLSSEKSNEEKESDNSIVFMPTKDQTPKTEKGFSTDETFDKNSNMDGDSILQKVTQQNPIEMETGKPISDDDAVNFKSINPYITIDEEGTPNGSPGYQKIVGVVDKPESSSIEELLNSHIPEDGLKLPSTDTEVITVIPIEKIYESSFKSKDDEVESSIPNDHNSQNIIEKNKSMEKLNPNSNNIIETPHIMKETVPNKYDKPNIYSKTLSKENPDTDIDVLDISDDYNNLGGMTMEDSDLKKSEHKLPNITDKLDINLTKKNKLIPDIMNKAIKPEIADNIGSLNFFNEKPEDVLMYNNGLSYEKANEVNPSDKSIVLEPKLNIIPKSEKGFSTDEIFDKNSNIDGDGILQKVTQPNPLESKNGKLISDVDAVNGKSDNILSVPNDDEVSDINKTGVKFSNRIIKQKQILNANDIVPSSNIHEKIIPGKSENDFVVSNSGQYGFSSLNSKVSIPDKHILITNKDEHSSVLNAIDKHNNSLLDNDEEIRLYHGFETKSIMDDSKDFSENQNKNIPVSRIKQQNKEFGRIAPNMEHTKNETFKEFIKTKINNDTFFFDNDKPKVNILDRVENNCHDSNNIDKLTKIVNENTNFYRYPSTMVTSEDSSPIISDYNLMNEDDNSYGYMLPKFSTKYIESVDSNNLWETVPPKKNNDLSIHKESDNYNNDINRSMDYTQNNIISSHVNNDKKIIPETETVKNSYDDKGNTDIHSKVYDDFIKKMSERLFQKIDDIDDKISKLDKLSNNSSYYTQSYNIRSDDPGTKKIILMNDLPISEPKNNIEEPDSKINKSVESHETMISYKSNDENVIKESTRPKKDKHTNYKRHNEKLRKHSKHDRYKKKKSHKKNDKNDNYDDDEDDDNYKVDGRQKKIKIHKKNDKKDDDDKLKKNKSRKKNETIDSDVDNDDDGRVKKKSHKKNNINDDNVKVSRSKKKDTKKKKKVKENLPRHESNEVNNSSSIQINSEDDDSVKGLKIKSKPKNPKIHISTKRKKSSPKRKSKHMKHSKSIKYKKKEIPGDISDEDSSSNKNNYNLEETYVKTSRNNNQNNAPKEKRHKHKERKHKKHKKPLISSKTYKYKEIPVVNEDKISDENNVNLEETYNINITNDDNALKQKRLRHKRLKKMKNIDINIVKDTDNQVLNRDTNTGHGYQFFTFYPQYRYTNPFARLFY